MQHCKALAPWEIITRNIQELNITSCSDGSATADQGSFGFVIATSQGLRLVSGGGPAPATYPNSFRSEAYGVLASIRWLYHAFRRFPPLTTTNKIRHYLDNRSVIKRVNSTHQSQQWPNQQLLPEHDVISEIVHSLKSLPVAVELEWVKGHQDETTPYHLLNVPAQLNCDADKLANEYANVMSEDDREHAQVPPLPHSPSQFQINHQTITSHIKRRVRDAASLPPLHKYLQQKFKWNKSTIDLIDWTNYSVVIQKYKQQWTTVVKHLHDISPTGHIAHRNNCHLPHECPACGSPQEDNTHVIICPHMSRSEWRQATVQKVSQYDTNTSDPYLLDILRDGLTRFHRQLDPVRVEDYPGLYHHLITHQNEVGWHHLYCGRWCKEWRLLQNHYMLRQRTITASVTSGSWLIGLGRMIIDQWIELWKLRNHQRHGKDQEYQSLLRETTLHSALRHIYTYRNQVCPCDRALFHSSAEEHIRQHPSLDTIENWLLTYKEAIEASVAQAARLGLATNRSILEFPTFNPIAQPRAQANMPAGLDTG
jgi:hypothetical protein